MAVGMDQGVAGLAPRLFTLEEATIAKTAPKYFGRHPPGPARPSLLLMLLLALSCSSAEVLDTLGANLVSTTEKLALQAIYEATDGAGWKKKGNWMLGGDVEAWSPCAHKWRAVHCDKDNTTITGLNLAKNELKGTLPTQIGLLPALGAISFRINELSGTLPTELGRLTLLKGVGLYNNLLSGTVPTELGALENAKSCWLNFNQCRTALDAASCGPTDNRNVFSCPEPGDSDADDPHEPLCFKNLRLGCDSDADGAKDEL